MTVTRKRSVHYTVQTLSPWTPRPTAGAPLASVDLHATNAFPCPIQGKRKVLGRFHEGRYLPSRQCPARPSSSRAPVGFQDGTSSVSLLRKTCRKYPPRSRRRHLTRRLPSPVLFIPKAPSIPPRPRRAAPSLRLPPRQDPFPQAVDHFSAHLESDRIPKTHTSPTSRQPLDSVETITQRVAPLGRALALHHSAVRLSWARGLLHQANRKAQSADRPQTADGASHRPGLKPSPSSRAHPRTTLRCRPYRTVHNWSLALQHPTPLAVLGALALHRHHAERPVPRPHPDTLRRPSDAHHPLFGAPCHPPAQLPTPAGHLCRVSFLTLAVPRFLAYYAPRVPNTPASRPGSHRLSQSASPNINHPRTHACETEDWPSIHA